MTNISAKCALKFLGSLNCKKPVLLRGGDSILRGEEQNDIDLFVGSNDQDLRCLFLPNTILSEKVTGPGQKKFFLKCSYTNETIEIDLFEQINWLGLPVIDIKNVPVNFDKSLGVYRLDKNTEDWILVTKNVLHKSLTPMEKLSDMSISPSYKVFQSDGNMLEGAFQKTVWLAIKHQEKYFSMYVFLARLLFLIIHFTNDFLRSVKGVLLWLKHRM